MNRAVDNTPPSVAIKLSVVILCWNSEEVITDCLRSLAEQALPFTSEVIVVDNGSADRTRDIIREHFAQFTLIENGANLGFAAGNNEGIARAGGDYVLFLNPDTVVPPGALAEFVRFADNHPGAAAFGCRMRAPDGEPQRAAFQFPTPLRLCMQSLRLGSLGHWSPLFSDERYPRWNESEERSVDWITGSCLLTRRKAVEDAGGFDARFFYHYEDVDLCRTFHNAGYQLLYTPSVTIMHRGNRPGTLPLDLETEKCRSRCRYFHKHFGMRGAAQCRRWQIVRFAIRAAAYHVMSLLPGASERPGALARINAGLLRWNLRLNLSEVIEAE